MPNPGSFTGNIPAWTGADFEELVRNEGELEEWILDGVPVRLSNNPLALHFLDHQAVKMPAYRGFVSAADISGIKAYLRWLRGKPLAPAKKAG